MHTSHYSRLEKPTCLPPKKDYHVYIARINSTYHYAYARQAQINSKRNKEEKGRQRKERKEKKAKNEKGEEKNGRQEKQEKTRQEEEARKGKEKNVIPLMPDPSNRLKTALGSWRVSSASSTALGRERNKAKKSGRSYAILGCTAPVAYQVILEPGIGQFREFEFPRVHTYINSWGRFLVHKLACGKRESVS